MYRVTMQKTKATPNGATAHKGIIYMGFKINGTCSTIYFFAFYMIKIRNRNKFIIIFIQKIFCFI